MKRIINFIGWMHPKNSEGAMLFKEFDIEFNGQSRDVVVNSSNVNGILGNVTMYGPSIDLISASNINDYPINMLSQWNIECVKQLNPNSNAISLPFPVNIGRFIPGDKGDTPIIYFKMRDIELLDDVVKFMYKRYKNIHLFDYEKGYKESDYINSCAKAPFCIWVGRHESQGFALQECLSSNTPILVIDVDSMYDEVNSNGSRSWKNGKHLKATAAPYFDDRCGIKTNIDNWKDVFDTFINNIDKYSPREYVIDNLSVESLTKKWKNFI
jgi:hypothetical protein